jgi:hypothetical protein
MPSSLIASHSYDAEKSELTITFTTGATYVYRRVPEDVAAAFSLALSKGKFFNARIRDTYRYRLVVEEDE